MKIVNNVLLQTSDDERCLQKANKEDSWFFTVASFKILKTLVWGLIALKFKICHYY